MSMVLLRAMLKKYWTLFVIFFGVLLMYLTVMTSIYSPDDMKSINAMLEMFPDGMMKAMGFDNIVSNLTGYLASWLYGLLMTAFPMVYSIILGNNLVAKMVDNGSFSCLLSTPKSRVTIIVTQGVYALLSMSVLFFALFGIGVMICQAAFPGLLDVSGFLSLNITTMLLNMTVMMIVFFFSCLFNESKTSLGFGAGVPIVFLLMKMLGDASDKLEAIGKVSIYSLYDPVGIAGGADAGPVNLFYMASILVLFACSVLIFRRKNLPL